MIQGRWYEKHKLIGISEKRKQGITKEGYFKCN